MKSNRVDEQRDRREWLAMVTRGVVLGGIAVTTGLLAMRGQLRICDHGGKDCTGCARRSRCRLPRADAARQQLARERSR